MTSNQDKANEHMIKTEEASQKSLRACLIDI